MEKNKILNLMEDVEELATFILITEKSLIKIY